MPILTLADERVQPDGIDGTSSETVDKVTQQLGDDLGIRTGERVLISFHGHETEALSMKFRCPDVKTRRSICITIQVVAMCMWVQIYNYVSV